MQRVRNLVALVALAALIVPATANAKTNVRVGLADQNVGMFADPNYQRLNLKLGRYFIRWDARKHPYALQLADQYLAQAKAQGVRVLLHLNTNTFVEKKAKLPSVKRYKRELRFLVRRYKRYTKDWGVWNEANHKTQPTYKSPKRAAKYFKTMRRVCRGCNIVALDLLDQTGAERYAKRFYRALKGRRWKRRAKVVGIHNYGDVNRSYRRGSGTRSIVRSVKRSSRSRRTKFYLTETGGLVGFGDSFPCNQSNPGPAERRAARALKNMFKLARKQRRSVKRLYVYNWTGTNCTTRFDVGLTRLDGSVRPGYRVFRRNLRKFKR
jgi:hypothetical protein